MIKLNAENVGNTGGFEPIAKGEYEVFPVAFEASVSQAGNEMVQFNYVIRDDVEQKFGGRELRFDRFVASDKAMWRINQASVAADLDMNEEYDALADWAKAFKFKAVRVYVDQETNNGKTYAVVKSFKKSEIGGEHTELDNSLDISDEQLPF